MLSAKTCPVCRVELVVVQVVLGSRLLVCPDCTQMVREFVNSRIYLNRDLGDENVTKDEIFE